MSIDITTLVDRVAPKRACKTPEVARKRIAKVKAVLGTLPAVTFWVAARSDGRFMPVASVGDQYSLANYLANAGIVVTN